MQKSALCEHSSVCTEGENEGQGEVHHDGFADDYTAL